MNYLQEFLNTEEPRELSLLEQIALSNAHLRQIITEINPNYRPVLNEQYFPEGKLLAWMDIYSQTPLYKLYKKHFPPNLHGIERIPNQGGAVIVANHTTPCVADVFPIFNKVYEEKRRIVYGTAHKLFEKSDWVKTFGGVLGERETAIKLLWEEKLILSCPEGIKGACRPYDLNHTILSEEGFGKGRVGYLKSAYRTSKPIIPVASVGAENAVIILGNIQPQVMKAAESLDSLVDIQRTNLGKEIFETLGKIKVFPLVANLFPFPRTVDAYVGQPINPGDYLGSNPSDGDFWEVNEMVMRRLQDLIDQGLRKRKSLAKRVVGRFSKRNS